MNDLLVISWSHLEQRNYYLEVSAAKMDRMIEWFQGENMALRDEIEFLEDKIERLLGG